MPKFTPPPAGALAFTINEVCFLARFGRDKFYAELNAGKIKTVRVGRRTLVPVAAAHEYLKSLGLEVQHAA